MIFLIANNYRHAELAAKEYQISSWEFVSSEQILRGLRHVTIAYAGPCDQVDWQIKAYVRELKHHGRVDTLRLRTWSRIPISNRASTSSST